MRVLEYFWQRIHVLRLLYPKNHPRQKAQRKKRTLNFCSNGLNRIDLQLPIWLRPRFLPKVADYEPHLTVPLWSCIVLVASGPFVFDLFLSTTKSVNYEAEDSESGVLPSGAPWIIAGLATESVTSGCGFAGI